MMPPPIRLLMVEDVTTDAELEVRELKRAGLRVEHRVVSTEPAFREAITGFAPQVIISDFSMPNFDGMAAAALARDLAPDVPFIFVSGTIGEEYAIRALKSGATDYVLKNNLIRLPAAVERALQEAAERAARRRAEGMFRDVFENAPYPMVMVEGGARIVLASARVADAFGYRPEELVGRPLGTLLPAGLPAGSSDADGEALHRDGRRVPVAIGVAAVRADGEPCAVACIRDQTERYAQEARIARLSRVRAMLGAVNAAIVRIREAQALFEELCRIAVAQGGFAVARVTDVQADGRLHLAATSEDDPSLYLQMLEAANRDPAGPGYLVSKAARSARVVVSNDVAHDERIINRDALTASGSYALALLPIVVEGRVAAVLGLRARDRGAFNEEELGLLREIVANVAFALELIEKQAQLDYLAYYDALTGLPNRRLFVDRLGQAIDAARREERMIGLAVFDLERFGAINDTFGNAAADEALRQVAARLAGTTRERTTPVGRLVGNTFAVVFAPIRRPEDIARGLLVAGERVLGPALTVGGREIRLAAKAGIAVYPNDGADAELLLRNAEAALLKAKQRGERYLFYMPQINARVSERVELEQRLRRAVDQHELYLHLQPKVELESRRIVGVEALMRWSGPDGRPVPPGQFVPVLEETGMIYEAGKQALARAAAIHRDWKAKAPDAPRVAVNVSALQLRRPGFVEDVLAAVGDPADAGVDLEVTESLMMEDVEASIAKLRSLREFGLRIALDDFGTGYSSLAYLGRLPIDTLKIDRGFINGISENANDVTLVTTMISLAQGLRLRTVAEGVETEEQARLLRLLRCDQMQGYLFSRPLPPEGIEALLRQAQG